MAGRTRAAVVGTRHRRPARRRDDVGVREVCQAQPPTPSTSPRPAQSTSRSRSRSRTQTMATGPQDVTIQAYRRLDKTTQGPGSAGAERHRPRSSRSSPDLRRWPCPDGTGDQFRLHGRAVLRWDIGRLAPGTKLLVGPPDVFGPRRQAPSQSRWWSPRGVTRPSLGSPVPVRRRPGGRTPGECATRSRSRSTSTPRSSAPDRSRSTSGRCRPMVKPPSRPRSRDRTSWPCSWVASRSTWGSASDEVAGPVGRSRSRGAGGGPRR